MNTQIPVSHAEFIIDPTEGKNFNQNEGTKSNKLVEKINSSVEVQFTSQNKNVSQNHSSKIDFNQKSQIENIIQPVEKLSLSPQEEQKTNSLISFSIPCHPIKISNKTTESYKIPFLKEKHFNSIKTIEYANLKNQNEDILQGLNNLREIVNDQKQQVVSLSVQVEQISLRNSNKKLDEIVKAINNTLKQVVSSMNEQLKNASEHFSIIYSKFDNYVLKGDFIELFRRDEEGTSVSSKCLVCGRKEVASPRPIRSNFWMEEILDQSRNSAREPQVKLVINDNSILKKKARNLSPRIRREAK